MGPETHRLQQENAVTDPGFPFDDADDPEDADDQHDSGRKAVFITTAEPVAIRVAPLEDARAPDGTALGSYIDGRLVARCAMPRESIDKLMDLHLLDAPVPLGLVVFEEEPGLQCRLVALVPADAVMEEDGDSEPWRQSVPSYEDSLGDDDDDGPGMAAILLGNIVRFDRDRKHRDDLVSEAIDVLQRIVAGGPLADATSKAVDDLLDSL